MTYIHLEASQVPSQFRVNGYSGNKFKVSICEKVTIPSHSGLWDGGSRDQYFLVKPSTGAAMIGSSDSSPWDPSRKDKEVILNSDVVVIEHSIFCGKDMGLTIYAHPQVIAPYLPKSDDNLTETMRTVLKIVRSYKSQYRKQYAGEAGISEKTYAAVIDDLKSSGYLTANGAITIKGKNDS